MPTRRGRSRTLDRQAIIDVSLQLIEEHGTDGLSMRAVADQLRVTPMAIYRHVSDKQELLRLILQQLSDGDARLLSVAGERWEVTLERYLLSRWQSLHRYPGLGAIALGFPELGISGDRFDEAVQFFADAGFPETHARKAVTFSTSYVLGRNAIDTRFVGNVTPREDERISREHLEFGIAGVVFGLRALRDHAEGSRWGLDAMTDLH